MSRFYNTPRIMISAVGSNCGKTTITMALLAVLKRRGVSVQSYKSGPDYIDPMFHSYITNRSTYHTDPYFSDENKMKQIVANTSLNSDLVLIEGAMGFYDGIGQTCESSAYTVSQWLKTPTLLLLSPSGMGASVAAICKGYSEFRTPNQIKGFILNKVKTGMYPFYKEIIEHETGLDVYGYLPDLPQVYLENRHLGLITYSEVEKLNEKIKILADVAEKTIDLDSIILTASKAEPLKLSENLNLISKENKFRLGVARDNAFCFYYEENLKMLEALGAEIVPFSPISDEKLPDMLDGLYFGGGYPELYLDALSSNKSFLENLRKKSSDKMPIFAECGGFMYLQEAIYDKDKVRYQMAGLLSGTSELGERLCRFGYITLTANKDTILGTAGTKIKAHEFHYSDSTENGDNFLAERPNGRHWNAIQCTENIIAGFPHMYFPSNPEIPEKFAELCIKFKKERDNKI